jgi:hypothetical protein
MLSLDKKGFYIFLSRYGKDPDESFYQVDEETFNFLKTFKTSIEAGNFIPEVWVKIDLITEKSVDLIYSHSRKEIDSIPEDQVISIPVF